MHHEVLTNPCHFSFAFLSLISFSTLARSRIVFTPRMRSHILSDGLVCENRAVQVVLVAEVVCVDKAIVGRTRDAEINVECDPAKMLVP